MGFFALVSQAPNPVRQRVEVAGFDEIGSRPGDLIFEARIAIPIRDGTLFFRQAELLRNDFINLTRSRLPALFTHCLQQRSHEAQKLRSIFGRHSQAREFGDEHGVR